MTRGDKVTVRDVAKAAGVSPATVSLVLNDKPGVSDATRSRVREAARELGYGHVPASRGRRTSTILLVIYKRDGSVVAETTFFEELIKGVNDATYARGYHRLSIMYFYAQQDAREQMKALRSVKCAGAILLATEMRARDVAQFEQLGVPLVILDNWFPSKPLDSVVIDNGHGAWEAVNHLSAMGHQTIGHLQSSVGIRNFLERREGWRTAVAGLGLPPGHVVTVGANEDQAYRDMLAHLDANEPLASAYFADNDIIAMGCIRAMRERGIRVPEDVSVVGFDDMLTSATFDVPLTTMGVPKGAMGALAVQRLAALIKGETSGESVRISVLPRIVERESVRQIEGQDI